MADDKSQLQFFDENQRWKLLVDSVEDYAMFLLDPDGRVASWNPGAERTKGYSAGEIIGCHFSIFYTSEDRRAGIPANLLKTALRDGRAELEGWRLRKDGSRFWAVVIIVPVRNADGALLGFAKVTRDITERVMARRALMEVERRFRLFVQSVTDYAIFMLDPEGFITNWNAGAQRIAGYTEEEAIGRHFSCFYMEEDRASDLPGKALLKARTEGKYEAEGRHVRKDGSYFRVHVVIDPVYDVDGSLIGYAKITRDITERLKTEGDLQQARDALFQARKMEAVGQLTGGIAHDFNNLLTVIVNSLEILSRKELSDREKRLLSNAQIAASRGARLTNQLLAFARRQPLAPHVHDLNALIGDFDSVLCGASGAVAKLVFNLAEGLPLTKVDSAQFEAAILNLVVNARDAMPDGGEIAIATAGIVLKGGEARTIGPLKAGKYVTVTVSDRGHGIPPGLQERVFEPFFTTKEAGKGTGLGLSQVYGFATQSGGGIEIVRSDDSGTSIRLYLPVTDEEPVRESLSGERADSVLAGMKVLVVDDEEEVRDSAVALLEAMRCETMVAGNAAAALDVLARNPETDVLFTDVVLRDGMDGFALAQAVHKKYPGLGIILTSGHPGKLSTEHRIVDGAQFLPKPYRREDLARRLEIVRKGRAREKARRSR